MAAKVGMSDPKDATTDPAVSVCFTVTVDDESLGYFSTCEGLGVEVVMEQREEGGNNGFIWQLPTRLKYSNVKLTRAVGKDSAAGHPWLIGFARAGEPQDRLHHRDDGRRAGRRQLEPRRRHAGALDRTQPQPGLAEGRHGDRRARPPRLPARKGS